MFIINETIVEDIIARKHFACDLSKCKGACCTLPGGRGAPLDDDEVVEIERAFPFARKYLSETHRNAIASRGMVEGAPGMYATACLNEKDCVFVYYEENIARCSLEKAYLSGETTWRKPISCHLFPLRISHGSMGRIRYEEIWECAPALSRGANEKIPLYIFLKDALIRKYGQEWYDELKKQCELSENKTS